MKLALSSLFIRALAFCFSINFVFITSNAITTKKSPKKTSSRNNSRINSSFSKTYTKSLPNFTNAAGNTFVWEQVSSIPFDELILSWNALRPSVGHYQFFVSIKNQNWSPWQKLAEWGSSHQKTFSNHSKSVHVAHSRVVLKNNQLANEFRIRVIAQSGALIEGVHKLFVCVSNLNKFNQNKINKNLDNIKIKNVPEQSQMVLSHDRSSDLCSPTSTSIVLSYLCSNLRVAPKENGSKLADHIIDFAKKVHDDGVLKIYGNWMLNTAQVYDSSYGAVLSRVDRLNNFSELYKYLKNNIPVVVSIRGGIKGGATPYANGHLLVVTGWDKSEQSVCCIDPAFSSSNATKVKYKIDDFLLAWGRSRNLAYVFLPRQMDLKLL